MDRSLLGQALWVGLGGFVGSIARFLASALVTRLAPSGPMPLGTFAVNVGGCLAIGFLGGLIEMRQLLAPSQRLFLVVGVLGGFTTFSTFAFEALSLARIEGLARLGFYVTSQVALGLVAAYCGYLGARALS